MKKENTKKIKIRKAFRDLIPPLTAHERDGLEESIEREGCRDPLIIWDGVLLDGHNRIKICKRLGIKYKTKEVAGLKTENDAKLWIIRNQLSRRNINESQRAMLAVELEELYAVEAKKRQRGGRGGILLPANLPEGSKGDAREHAAKDMNVSPRLVQSAKTVKARGSRELTKAVMSGGLSVSAAVDISSLPKKAQSKVIVDGEKPVLEVVRKIREEKSAVRREENERARQELINQPLNIPDGRFQTIVIDPPWPMKKIERDARPEQYEFDYPVMTEEELEDFPLPEFAADDCHLYLWTTHRFLPMALHLAEHWGFRYQCMLAWIKNVGMTPFSWMYSFEPILFCKQGSLPLKVMGKRLDFNAKVRKHSRKPDEFYDLVKKVSPGPRIDIFSREVRKGFKQYGNDTEQFKG